jgi:hypothetical protein
MTAVEWLLDELSIEGYFPYGIPPKIKEQAKEMDKEQKIEFACAVYDKYNFGPQEISFREECEQFKSE